MAVVEVNDDAPPLASSVEMILPGEVSLIAKKMKKTS